MPGAKLRAYSRCQVNGGCTTTVGAPNSCASNAERRSRSHGSLLHTRWVSSRHGAWMESTGMP